MRIDSFERNTLQRYFLSINTCFVLFKNNFFFFIIRKSIENNIIGL